MTLVCVLGAMSAGCTAEPATSARPTFSLPPRTSRSLPPPRPEAVPWMNGFCTIVREVQQAIWQAPVEKQANTDEEARQAFSVGFASASDALAAATRRLGEMGASPVAGGETARSTLTEKFSTARQWAIDGKARLDALPSGDDGRAVVTSVWPRLTAMAAKPFEGVTITDPMRAAAEAAGTNCVWMTGWPS